MCKGRDQACTIPARPSWDTLCCRGCFHSETEELSTFQGLLLTLWTFKAGVYEKKALTDFIFILKE